MLSLVVVLSVYYIMSPESKNAVQMQSEKARLTAERLQLKSACQARHEGKNGAETETETEKEDGTKGTKDSSGDKETSAEASEKELL